VYRTVGSCPETAAESKLPPNPLKWVGDITASPRHRTEKKNPSPMAPCFLVEGGIRDGPLAEYLASSPNALRLLPWSWDGRIGGRAAAAACRVDLRIARPRSRLADLGHVDCPQPFEMSAMPQTAKLRISTLHHDLMTVLAGQFNESCYSSKMGPTCFCRRGNRSYPRRFRM